MLNLVKILFVWTLSCYYTMNWWVNNLVQMLTWNWVLHGRITFIPKMLANKLVKIMFIRESPRILMLLAQQHCFFGNRFLFSKNWTRFFVCVIPGDSYLQLMELWAPAKVCLVTKATGDIVGICCCCRWDWDGWVCNASGCY